MGDVHEVLEELAGHVLVGGVVVGQLQGDGQHVEAVHGHPARAVRLLEAPAGGQGRRAVEDADVVEAQEAALEDVLALGVLAVHPPREVQQELVEDLLEEGPVARAAAAALDLVDAQGRPGVHGRIDVAQRPLVGGDLPVGVHVPLAQEQEELRLGEVRIDEGQGMQWKARSHAAYQGYSHLSGMEMTSSW